MNPARLLSDRTAPATHTVLVVEDSADDALLVGRLLRRGAPGVRCAHAGSLAEALDALAAEPHAAVLLDLSLPDAEDLDGVRAIRAGFPDLPIVVLTGRRDDIGAQALQLGAQDYLNKDDLDDQLLGRTVRYSIERARIAGELAAAQTRFRHAFDDGPLGMALLSVDPTSAGRVLDANRALAGILACPLDDLAGTVLQTLVHWEDHAKAAQLLDRVAAGVAVSERLELRLLRSDGTLAWASLTVSLVATQAGSPLYAIAQVEDISARRAAEEELQEANAALDNAVGGIARVDLSGRLCSVNPAYVEILGRRAEDLVGDEWRSGVHPADRPTLERAHEQMLQAGRAEAEVRVVRPGGRVVDAALVLVHNVGRDGQLKGHFCFARDITERKSAERALATSERRYREIVETTGEAVVILDHDARVTFANGRTAALLDVAGEEVLGRSLLDFVEAGCRQEVEGMLGRCRVPGFEGSLQQDVRLRRTDGSVVWGLFSAAATVDGRTGLGGTLVMISDITDRKRVEAELADQALRDTLTGLPNRALLLDRLGHSLRRHARERTGVALLFLDLDRFKLVNDELGHAAGDQLLRRVVPRIKEAIRDADTLARFGGDEFVVLCDGVSDQREAIAIAQRIIARMEAPLVIEGSEVAVSVSIGVATSLGRTATSQELVRDADTAMYRAKDQGGGRYELYDEGMRARLLDEVRLERDLRRAVDDGRLYVAYQPIVALPGGAPAGFEALVRWEHPERGPIPPSEFVVVAERTGLIRRIGEFVLSQVCRQLARWHAEHPDRRWTRVTVNVSAHQLATDEFVATVARVLRETGVPPTALTLEITETALLSGSAATAGALRDLKALGLRLVLDDFGTGYSSISHLVRYPVDGLKIDRSFVAGLHGPPGRSTRPVVEAILGMAASLGVEVIAEGVETQEQADTLGELACGYAQGYHFARPMLPAAAIEWAAAAPPVVALPRHVTATLGETVTMQEATAALGVSPSTLRRWADCGRVEVVRTAGGHRRIPLSELQRLSRSRRGSGGTVALAEPASQPLPAVADALARDGARLARTVTERLYEPPGGGFLASPAGMAVVDRWVATLREGCRSGDYTSACQASADLVRQVRLGGGTLVESQCFLERLGEALTGVVARGGDREQAVGCRRLFAALRLGALRAAE